MINCCPKHFAWSVLGTPPLAKHENRCETEEAKLTSGTVTTAKAMGQAGLKARTVSGGRSGTSKGLTGNGSVQFADDILDILCKPNPGQYFVR